MLELSILMLIAKFICFYIPNHDITHLNLLRKRADIPILSPLQFYLTFISGNDKYLSEAMNKRIDGITLNIKHYLSYYKLQLVDEV